MSLRFNDRDVAYLASPKHPRCRPQRTGMLRKKGELNQAFQPRWFLLSMNMLFYFKTANVRVAGASDALCRSRSHRPDPAHDRTTPPSLARAQQDTTPVGFILLEDCRIHANETNAAQFSITFSTPGSRSYVLEAVDRCVGAVKHGRARIRGTGTAR